LHIYSNDTIVPYHCERRSGSDMHFRGNEKSDLPIAYFKRLNPSL